MPSQRFTKVNIDLDTYAMLKDLAAAKGVSATKMLEFIILSYLKNNEK